MSGDIEAYLFRVDPRSLSDRTVEERCLPLLSPAERARHDRLAAKERRLELAATHALVRLALAQVTGEPAATWAVRRDSLGRPLVEGPVAGLHASVTHTPGLVACLIAPCDAGVDAELLSPRVPYMRIAEQVFSPTELAGLKALDDQGRIDRFFLLWSIKEALAKARGEGITAPPDRISVEPHPDGSVEVDVPADCTVTFRHWCVHWQRPTPEHILATCVATPDGRPPILTEHVGLP
ncbi:MAG: 4'-phosphopantetheinyl transferase superfamily protein [Kofleriaceae bacterium]|nr:4'-phosphopantetheinyl transferase superfamily protein [Kofleriaceae bacterium]